MKALLRKLALGLLAGLLVISGVWLDFYLPEKSITTITGVEVKRVDKDGPIGKENPADGPTTDVYYLYTVSAGEKVRVFRNEDTGWGFPFYFKFNSADVQARAKALEFEKGLARITSYGWRLNMFSWFPNVTKIERVESTEVSTFSFFRWLGFGLWLLGWGWIGRLVWRSDWAWPDAEV